MSAMDTSDESSPAVEDSFDREALQRQRAEFVKQVEEFSTVCDALSENAQVLMQHQGKAKVLRACILNDLCLARSNWKQWRPLKTLG